jgi:hypothetical protein
MTETKKTTAAHQGKFGDYTMQGVWYMTPTHKLAEALSWDIISWNLENNTCHHFRMVDGELVVGDTTVIDGEDCICIVEIDPEERKQIIAATDLWEMAVWRLPQPVPSCFPSSSL